MKETDSSRRAFLAQSGTVLGAAWISMSFPSLLKAAEATWREKEADPSLKVLTEEEAADLEAIASQIFPSDGTPGAREAGVVNFIDGSLASFNSGLVEPIRGGLAAVGTKTAELFPETSHISSLGFEDQMAVMKAIESEPYFGLFRFLTLVGMFSHPSYGGNRDRTGWKLLGFDDRHAWQPPFGYYDANYSEEN
ncbi:MAG TPA: gluconate 2-dehydrogenase subunit 3 family protein [Rhodothermales bacterium]